MCASYGLGTGPFVPDHVFDLEPLDERENRLLLEEWMRDWGGKANTTRSQKRGVNLNPIILPDADGGRALELAWWWLHVGGVPAKFSAFNSRDDALATRWKGPFQHRALLPATWYTEGGKRWQLPDGELFAIAAIVAPRRIESPREQQASAAVEDRPTPAAPARMGLSYSMVTRHGVGEAASVISSRGESRMPLVIPRELHDEWLDPSVPGDAELVARVQLASEAISRDLTAGGIIR